MAHADSFVSLSEMVNEYLDSLWRNIRFSDEDGTLAEAEREADRRVEGGAGEPEPPETWE